MTMIWTTQQPSVMMVRARRGESERAMTLALTAVMTAISAVHQKAARARFYGFESVAAPVDMISSATSRCQLRLAQQGNGPVQKVVVGLFVHILARAGQRGSRCR